MNLATYMKHMWAVYGEMTVRAVCFPLPPTPVGSVIFMPDSFISRTFEGVFDRPKEFKLVDVKPSKFGPALLAYIKLNKFLNFDPGTGYLSVPHSTLCASVSFVSSVQREDGITFADDVALDRVNMAHRSCHPGSHYAIPNAPYLTSLLQYAQAPSHNHSIETRVTKYVHIEYATPEQAGELFKAADFTNNGVIDNFLGENCVIDPKVSFFKTGGGIGRWTAQYLKNLRHNVLKKERKNAPTRRIALLSDAC